MMGLMASVILLSYEDRSAQTVLALYTEAPGQYSGADAGALAFTSCSSPTFCK